MVTLIIIRDFPSVIDRADVFLSLLLSLLFLMILLLVLFLLVVLSLLFFCCYSCHCSGCLIVDIGALLRIFASDVSFVSFRVCIGILCHLHRYSCFFHDVAAVFAVDVNAIVLVIGDVGVLLLLSLFVSRCCFYCLCFASLLLVVLWTL